MMKGKTRAHPVRRTINGPDFAVRAPYDGVWSIDIRCTSRVRAECPHCTGVRGYPSGAHGAFYGSDHGYVFDVVVDGSGRWKCGARGLWARRVQAALTAVSATHSSEEKEVASTEEGPRESRPKGTSDVVEATTLSSDTFHGGDSASGEVPDGKSGGADAPSSAATDRSSSGASEGNGSPTSESSAVSSSEEGGTSSSKAGSPPAIGKEGRDSEGSAGTSDSRASSDTGRSDALSEAADSDGEGTGSPVPEPPAQDQPEPDGRVLSPGGAQGDAPERREVSPALPRLWKEVEARHTGGVASGPSSMARMAYGGMYGRLARARPSPDLIRRARGVFSRLLRGGEGAPGPRWNWERVSLRTAGYLRPWGTRDRKEEEGRPALLVLPDVSGSMSAYADQVLALALAIRAIGGLPGGEIVAVAHSNGYPTEAWFPGRREPESVAVDDDIEAVEFYSRLIRRYDVRAIVVAADWDGEWLYRRLDEDHDVVIYWCDVWSSSKLLPTVVPFPPRWVLQRREFDWPPRAAARVRYAFGCGSAPDALVALEKFVKEVVL